MIGDMRRILGLAMLLMAVAKPIQAADPADHGELVTQIYRLELPSSSGDMGGRFGEDLPPVGLGEPVEPESREALFLDKGVPFPDGAFARYWRPFKFLVVRNTVDNLARVDAVIDRLRPPKHQIHLEWQWFEVLDQDLVKTGTIPSMTTEELERLGPEKVRWEAPIRLLVVEGTNAVVRIGEGIPWFAAGTNATTAVDRLGIGKSLSVRAWLGNENAISIEGESVATQLVGWNAYAKGKIQARQPVVRTARAKVSVQTRSGETRVIHVGEGEMPLFATVRAQVETQPRRTGEPPWKRDRTTLVSRYYGGSDLIGFLSDYGLNNRQVKAKLVKMGIPFPEGASVSWEQGLVSLTVVNTVANIALLDQILGGGASFNRVEVGLVEIRNRQLEEQMCRNQPPLEDIRKMSPDKARILNVIGVSCVIDAEGCTRNVVESNIIREIADHPVYRGTELGAVLYVVTAMADPDGPLEVGYKWNYTWMAGQEKLTVNDRVYRQPRIAAREMATTYRANDGETRWFSLAGASESEASTWWLVVRVDRIAPDGRRLDQPPEPVRPSGAEK
jgi:hypothetical protein